MAETDIRKQSWFDRTWAALTDEQKELVRHKARWEQMTLMAVLREWFLGSPHPRSAGEGIPGAPWDVHRRAGQEHADV